MVALICIAFFRAKELTLSQHGGPQLRDFIRLMRIGKRIVASISRMMRSQLQLQSGKNISPTTWERGVVTTMRT